MKTNVRVVRPLPVRKTHEGGIAANSTNLQDLRRTAMNCLLWEDTFYESGSETAARIKDLVSKVRPEDAMTVAIEAKNVANLRHVPLFIARCVAKAPKGLKIAPFLYELIQRPEEIPEFLAMYRKDNPKEPLSKQVKLGLGAAFSKFNEYQLAKWDRRDAAYSLLDAMRLVHPASEPATYALLGKLKKGELASPETWEIRLSRGEDKKTVFTEMIGNKTLGYSALVKNLRNCRDSGVDKKLVHDALMRGAEKARIFPYNFYRAAQVVPEWESMIEEAMLISAGKLPKLPGTTLMLVDNSRSMYDYRISAGKGKHKHEMLRIDAAIPVAIMANNICENAVIYAFAHRPKRVYGKGFALGAAIKATEISGTHIAASLREIYRTITPDRTLVITDGESQDGIIDPVGRGYMNNIASYRNVVGYGNWTTVDGFSTQMVSFMSAVEGVSIAEDEEED